MNVTRDLGYTTPEAAVELGGLATLAYSPHWCGEINQLTMQAVLRYAGEFGIAAARGWIDGWWYTNGNRESRSNATWRAARAALGSPLPDID